MVLSSIWVRAFLLVLQHLSCLCIHPDFINGTAALDIERVTKTTAALLAFQFFVRDSSSPALHSDGAGLIDDVAAREVGEVGDEAGGCDTADEGVGVEGLDVGEAVRLGASLANG